MKKLPNVKYEIIPSIEDELKEVMVTYDVNGKFHHHFIFLQKKNKLTDKHYLKQAKKQFEADYKSGKIKDEKIKTGRNKPWLIATTCVLGVATLTLGGLFTYKMLADDRSKPEPEPVIEREITYEEAQNWLDERYYDVNPETIVQSADASWDYNETTGESLINYGMPHYISHFIDESLGYGSILETTKQKAAENYNYTDWTSQSNKSWDAYSGKMLNNYINSVYGKVKECSVKGDNLIITFMRRIMLPTSSGSFNINVEETDIFNETCQFSDIKKRFDNIEINYPGFGTIQPFEGIANGYVDIHYNYRNFNSAYKWVDNHFDQRIGKIKKTRVYTWDFSETTDTGSQGYVLSILTDYLDESISELTGEKIVEDSSAQPETGITPFDFKRKYEGYNNALFELDESGLRTTLYDVCPELRLSLNDLKNLHSMTTYDNECFATTHCATFNHSQTTSKQYDITGFITTKFIYQ